MNMATTAFPIDHAAIAASRMTIAGWFTSQVAIRGDAVALQQGERTLSYRALNDRANRLVYWLAGHGVSRGDRIAILSENRSEYIELELAAAKLGAVTACQNWRQADRELTHCIRAVSRSSSSCRNVTRRRFDASITAWRRSLRLVRSMSARFRAIRQRNRRISPSPKMG